MLSSDQSDWPAEPKYAESLLAIITRRVQYGHYYVVVDRYLVLADYGGKVVVWGLKDCVHAGTTVSHFWHSENNTRAQTLRSPHPLPLTSSGFYSFGLCASSASFSARGSLYLYPVGIFALRSRKYADGWARRLSAVWSLCRGFLCWLVWLQARARSVCTTCLRLYGSCALRTYCCFKKKTTTKKLEGSDVWFRTSCCSLKKVRVSASSTRQ